jgi:hypothetical protein
MPSCLRFTLAVASISGALTGAPRPAHFITIAGFMAWALVFVVAPLMTALWPAVHIESEVWNLPKLGYYVVAVGMILLLLEDQIENDVAAVGMTMLLLEDQIQHNKAGALNEEFDQSWPTTATAQCSGDILDSSMRVHCPDDRPAHLVWKRVSLDICMVCGFLFTVFADSVWSSHFGRLTNASGPVSQNRIFGTFSYSDTMLKPARDGVAPGASAFAAR